MFDSVEDERDIGLQISRWENEGKIRMIEKGDKFEAVKSQLLKIKQALEMLKKLGINRDVMETYIYSKSKVGKAQMQDILYHQEQFLKKLGVL
jgi:hypothetical protein